MKKKQLLEMKKIEPTKAMIKKAKEQRPIYKKEKWRKEVLVKYKIGSYAKAEYSDGIVRVAIFRTKRLREGDKEPEYTIFMDPVKREFVTWNHREKKWSESMMTNLDGWWMCYGDNWLRTVFFMPRTRKILSESMFHGIYVDNKQARDGIIRFQEDIRKEQREERYRKETEPWDEEMKSVPEIPKDFTKWACRWGTDEHLMIYKYERKGANQGYCTSCQRIVPIKRPKYGEKRKCIKCGRTVEYKSEGRTYVYQTEREPVYLIQKCAEGIWIRQFQTFNRYEKHKWYRPETHLWEERRVLMQDGKLVSAFYYGNYKQKEFRFIKTEPVSGYERYLSEEGYIYTRNIERAGLEKSGLPVMAKRRIKIDAEMYMAKERRMPVLEKMAKAGLENLVKDYLDISNETINLNVNETKLSKILKLDSGRMKRMKSMKGNRVALIWLQEEKKNNTEYSNEMILEFMRMEIRPEYIKDMLQYMSLQKIANYLKKQEEITGKTARSLIQTWLDYMHMVKRLRMDDKNSLVYKPKNLKEEHDRLIKMVHEKGMELKAWDVLEKFENVEKRQQEVVEKYTFEDKKYAIIVPTTVQDILLESNRLSLCLDTTDIYWDRIEHRETYLVWLRRKEDIEAPWYVIEVQPGGSVRQKRTLGDNQNDDYQEAVRFIQKWQKEIKKRMSDEDIQLERISTQKRIAEIEKLRKDGNRIHRGKLQGKLLADVLEKDYMDIGGFENVG